VRAFYEDFGRGMDGMQLPYEAKCFRAVVVDRPASRPEGRAEGRPAGTTDGDATDGSGAPVSDGADTDMLLIDFR
jgi:hypothetical protein